MNEEEDQNLTLHNICKLNLKFFLLPEIHVLHLFLYSYIFISFIQNFFPFSLDSEILFSLLSCPYRSNPQTIPFSTTLASNSISPWYVLHPSLSSMHITSPFSAAKHQKRSCSEQENRWLVKRGICFFWEML